jgi:hypothetical protein
MNKNYFKEGFQKLSSYKLSGNYKDADERLYDSTFTEKIGHNIIDTLLRKLVCTYS